MSGSTEHLRLLLRLDRERVRAAVREPTPRSIAAVGVPVLLLASALVVLGSAGDPTVDGVGGGVTVGALVSGIVAFVAYGTLFGGGDTVFLRQLGIDARALYLERCLRLLTYALLTAAALVVPFAVAGGEVATAAAVTLSAGIATAGTAALVFAGAARAVTGSGPNRLGAGIRQFDPQLARAAPLVYAPLPPFLVGIGFGGAAAAESAPPVVALIAAAIASAVMIRLAAIRYGRAAPRFQPLAREMAFVPPPEGGGQAFNVGSGLTRLLPRRAALTWIRDATIANRRFAWAGRVSWPVGIVSIVALARWGEVPMTRVWVVVAVGAALAVQGAAVVALGRLERGRTLWLDRAAAVSWSERLLGRWAWSWGMSLWLLVPIAFAWAWWSGVSGALAFPLAGALTAAAASTISILTAERRV